MKKIIAIITLCILAISCNSVQFADITESFLGERLVNVTKEQKYKAKMASYKLEAKIITNKGDINLFLYPDGAPETVANFVFLCKKNFYDNMKFHRVLPNNLIQIGDNKGDTTGDAGYFIKDEITNWLNFDKAGMIAMAKNSNKDSASSQFFITLTEKQDLNGRYAVFGNLKTKQDLLVAKSIRVGDVIKDIQITGVNVNDFLNNFKPEVEQWNKKLLDK